MKIERRSDPGPFSKHSDYKQHLRLLFRCRCAYCLTPDDRLGGEEAMTVDHFKPVARYKDLKLTWSNLYYACIVCNSHYKKDFPSPEEEAAGKRFVDPCSEDPDDHFRLVPDPDTGDLCRVRPLSESVLADYTIYRLKFNQRRFLRDFWREIHQEERQCLKRKREIHRCLKSAPSSRKIMAQKMNCRIFKPNFKISFRVFVKKSMMFGNYGHFQSRVKPNHRLPHCTY